MTSLDSHSLVLSHFVNSHYLNYTQVAGLAPKNENIDNAVAAIMCTLDDLTSSGVLYKHQEGKDNKTITWVLRVPLGLQTQTIQISGPTALSISNVVSQFAEVIEQEDIKANPLNIKENDIVVLLDLINMYVNDVNDDDEPEEIKDNKSK